MADPPHYPDSSGDTGDEPDRGLTTGTPRWVKVSGIVGLVLVLLLVIMMSTGGGGHGPGRHTPSGDAGGQAPPSSVMEDHAPPEGGH